MPPPGRPCGAGPAICRGSGRSDELSLTKFRYKCISSMSTKFCSQENCLSMVTHNIIKVKKISNV